MEIGPGGGTLAKILLSGMGESVTNYTLVDHPRMLENTSNTLGVNNKVSYVKAHQIASLENQQFDIIISTGCLSETAENYMEYLYTKIFPNCSMVFIVDGGNEFLPKLKKRLAEIYPNIEIIPWTEPCPADLILVKK